MQKNTDTKPQPVPSKAQNKKQIGEDYYVHLDRFLGKGTYGEVYQAFHKHNGRHCVAKVQSITKIKDVHQRNKLFNQVNSEIVQLGKVHHSNVMGILDVRRTSSNIYLFLEQCTGGSLSKYVDGNQELPEDKILSIFIQIFEAFVKMHELKIIHRDIKPDNIMFDAKDNVKVADFGFARAVEDNTDQALKQSILGTPLQMSPQITLKQKYNYKCDVWSTGVMLYQLLFGKFPFIAKNAEDINNQVKNLQNGGKVQCPSTPLRSRGVIDLVLRMMQFKEDERASWEECLVRALECLIEFQETQLISEKKEDDKQEKEKMSAGSEECDLTRSFMENRETMHQGGNEFRSNLMAKVEVQRGKLEAAKKLLYSNTTAPKIKLVAFNEEEEEEEKAQGKTFSGGENEANSNNQPNKEELKEVNKAENDKLNDIQEQREREEIIARLNEYFRVMIDWTQFVYRILEWFYHFGQPDPIIQLEFLLVMCALCYSYAKFTDGVFRGKIYTQLMNAQILQFYSSHKSYKDHSEKLQLLLVVANKTREKCLLQIRDALNRLGSQVFMKQSDVARKQRIEAVLGGFSEDVHDQKKQQQIFNQLLVEISFENKVNSQYTSQDEMKTLLGLLEIRRNASVVGTSSNKFNPNNFLHELAIGNINIVKQRITQIIKQVK